LLGYGWKLGFEISVRLEEDRTLLFDAAGRVITFEEGLAPGQSLRSASEDLWLMRGGGMGLGQTVAALTSTGTAGPSSTANANVATNEATNEATNTPEELLPWTEQACWSHVPAKLKADPAFVLAASGGSGGGGRTVWAMLPVSVNVPANAPSGSNPPNPATHRLVGLLDQFGRHQQYHYDEYGRVQRIDDGVGRRYVLLYNQDKPEATKPPSAPASPAAKAPITPSLLGPDSGLRLTGVDLVHNPLDADHTSSLPGRAKPIPLVRYRYNALGDLAEVYGRDGQRTRQFSYDTAHRMVAHRVDLGPGHSYVYEDQTPAAKRASQAPRPGARVVEQHNEEGLSYFFEYRDAPVMTAAGQMTATASTAPPTSQVIVRDSLNRVTHYHFEGSGGDKRLTRLVNPDGSQETYRYNGAGQRMAATDALGRTTYWRYDGLGRLLGIQGPDGKSSHQTWGLAGSAQDGLVVQSTSTSGVVTRYDYDALGRLTQITSAAGTDAASTTRLEYAQAQPGQTLAAAVLPPKFDSSRTQVLDLIEFALQSADYKCGV
jgi:YD repeat-containing protein